MNLHNSYTLTCGGRKATALNTVSENFLAVFAKNPAWAKFIALTETNGKRTESPASLRFINADILAGGTLRAVYAAAFEVKEGAVYKEVSIVAEAGGEAVSAAALSFTGSAEKITVTAVIELEVAYDGEILLTGGDNGLVRRLLGAGSAGEFALATGTSTYPLYPSLRSDLLQSEAETVTPQTEGKSLVLRGKTAMDGTELLLRYNDKTVLRALRPTVDKNTPLALTVENGAVCIKDRLVRLVTGVAVGGASITRYDSMQVSTHALQVGENTVAVGVDGSVISDPGEEFMAIVTHAFVEVYEVDPQDGRVTSILRVPRENEQVSLCRGGSLTMWSSEALTIYDRSNREYSTRRIAIPVGSKSIVLREGILYHAATLREGTFYRYSVQGGSATLLESTVIDTPSRFLLGHCGDSVLYGSAKTFKVCSISIDYTADFACDTFSLVSNLVETAGDFFVITSRLGVGTVFDFVRNTSYSVTSGSRANGRLIFRADKAIYIYDVANGLRVLEGEYDTAGLTSAVLAGGFLFTVTNGVVRRYYLSGRDVAIRLPVSANGKTCTLTVRHKEPQGDGPVAFYIT